MTERSDDPQMLLAIGAVGALYFNNTTFEAGHEEFLGDQDWEETVANFPQYQDKITELKKLLEAVKDSQELYRGLYHGRVPIYTELAVLGVGDELSRPFLATILWGRAIRPGQGFFDPESIRQARDRTFVELRQAGYSTKLTMTDALEAVLLGRLGLDRVFDTPTQG